MFRHDASRGSPPPAYRDIHRHPVISEPTDQINVNPQSQSNHARTYQHYHPGQQHSQIPQARRFYYQEPLHGQHWTIIQSHRGRHRAEDEAFVNQMVLDVNRRTVVEGESE